MNILHFADFSAPYEGNFIVSLKNLEEKLKEQNSNMIYLFNNNAREQKWAKELLASGKYIYFLGSGIFENVFIIREIIKKHNINIIHTHFSVFKYDLIIKLARVLLKKTMYIRHMHMLYKNRSNFLFEKLKRFISNADIEITCGQAAYEAMVDVGFKKKNLINVTNAIDFKRLDNYQVIDKGEMGMTSQAKIILMFGYSYLVKGVDLAVNAVKIMIIDGFDVQLLIVVAKDDSAIANKITEEFGEIPSYIKLLPPRGDVASYYRLADVFLSASRFEAHPYAIREAAYLECLTVVSSITAHRMTDYDIIFNNGNYADLAKKLEEVISNNNSLVIQKQKEFVLKEYSIGKWCDEIINIYSGLKQN